MINENNSDNSQAKALNKTDVSGWQNSDIRFRHLRQQRGLTLREVETKIGISNAYLSQLETGKIKSPSFQTVIKLLELYGVPLVSPEIAETLIKVRDCLVSNDYDEAYHLLCSMADPDLKNINHWAKLEGLAKSSTACH